jgi:hypothetical protein
MNSIHSLISNQHHGPALQIFKNAPERIVNIYFIELCKEGHLPVIQWIWQNRRANTSFDAFAYNNSAFLSACKYGHIAILQWMAKTLNNTYLNIRGKTGFSGFNFACKYGHLDIVKWFHERTPTFSYEQGFKNACVKGHSPIIRWFTEEMSPETFHAVFDENGLLQHWFITYHALPIEYVQDVSFEYNECGICETRLTDIWTVCRHSFCYTCLNQWFQNNSSCPYCRQTITHCFTSKKE